MGGVVGGDVEVLWCVAGRDVALRGCYGILSIFERVSS